MLVIDVKMNENYDEETGKFVPVGVVSVKLEHSLVSLSKWESKFEKSFLSSKDKSPEELLSYIKMMIVGDDFPPEVFAKLLEDHVREINTYISAAMTATTFREDSSATKSREIVTAEIIYYWMISMNIPMECQHWHLNRLLTLVRVISLKNAPKKKMSTADRRKLNRERQARYNTKG